MSKLAQVLPALHLVVAVADNGVIGLNQGLPWRQRADLRHFKKLTLGHPIAMGRRTYESIGKPLPGRENLVLTTQPGAAFPGTTVVDSLDAARAAARGAERLYVIGGAVVYAEALPQAEVIHLTEVHGTPDGDVRFPHWDRAAFDEVEREDHPADAENQYPFSFVTLRRR